MFDLCVVGGGMSGMTAAITAARLGSKVLLIEKNNKLGKKIYATGNGKCNLGNTYIDYSCHYNSTDDNYIDFLLDSCGDMPTKDLTDFFASCGIYITEKNGYLYPNSMQASAVVWAMIDELKRLNVDIWLDACVENIHKKDDIFEVKTRDTIVKSKKLILSCGGNSYSKLGGSMVGYDIAKGLGHDIIPLRPSLCGLITKEDISSLAGVRVHSKASLICDASETHSEEGELQFTEYGLSGIMIFNLSSKVGKILKQGKSISVVTDLIPNISENDFYSIIQSNSNRTVLGMLNSIINDKLAGYILKLSNISPKDKISSLDKKALYDILCDLKKFNLDIVDIKDYDNAQLTAGGVDISKVSSKTLMSKIVDGLYITGEMLDIDGLCGGYNIAFAVLSGIKAGYCSYDKNK